MEIVGVGDRISVRRRQRQPLREQIFFYTIEEVVEQIEILFFFQYHFLFLANESISIK